MAYADQSMSGNKITALIIVALIHIVLVYALVTGLAYEGARVLIQKVTTVDIKEPEKPKEEPPPPPPKQLAPPPIVAPPVKIDVNPVAPPIITVPVAPPPPPVFVAPAAPPPPPPSQARAARPKNQSSWAARIQDNYPSDALRMEKEGRVGVRVTVGPDGRVSACTVTNSSGTPSLDRAACDGMERYARYDPALNDAGNPTSGSISTAIVYRLN
ncbi:MAG: energy transducer TonB [Sphingomonadales bacterium]|nr:energy transducer TonB [Sphingomonadales bacterium]MBU3992017.1 energy transducer TonB [Alphaproteobacteria bacterium]